MKRNYMDKTHDDEDKKTYYSIFREYDEQEFKNAVKQVLLNQSYFPRIDEISKYLLVEVDVPKWFNEKLENEQPTQQEIQEMDKILEGLEEMIM